MIRAEHHPSHVQLGDVVEFLDHQRRPITAKDRIPGEIPYYGANGQQDSVSGHIFDEPLVLLAEDGGYFDNPSRGIAYRIDGKSWVNNHAHVLRPRAGTEIAFLARLLENYDVRPYLTGTTRAKLTKAAASRIPITLPPLNEQRRIAAILDKADELRTKRRQALAHLDTLAQSIFHRLESGLSSVPRVRLTEVCIRIQTGPFGSLLHKEDYVIGGVPLVNPMHIRAGKIFAESSFSVSTAKFRDLEGYRLIPGDVVLGRRGEIGRCAEVLESHGPMLCGTGSLIIRPSPKHLDSTYLSAVLSGHAARKRLMEVAQGATMLNLNTKIVGNLEVPLPPLKLQQTFATQVAAVERLKESHRKHLAELDALFASLQHRAFKGEL